LVFVDRTEQALVSRAIACQTQQKAAGFVGGSNGALFKSGVAVVHAIPVVRSDFKNVLRPVS